MVIKFCKNRRCEVVINEYNADCSCVFCDKEIKQCTVINCADKGVIHASKEFFEHQSRKCQGCMNYSRYLLSQHTR